MFCFDGVVGVWWLAGDAFLCGLVLYSSVYCCDLWVLWKYRFRIVFGWCGFVVSWVFGFGLRVGFSLLLATA